MKDNGYHDAENEVDQETDDDADRVLSGKLSESSGYAGSDLYEYKVFSSIILFSPIVYLMKKTNLIKALLEDEGKYKFLE